MVRHREEEVQRLRKLFGFEDYKSFEFPKNLLINLVY